MFSSGKGRRDSFKYIQWGSFAWTQIFMSLPRNLLKIKDSLSVQPRRTLKAKYPWNWMSWCLERNINWNHSLVSTARISTGSFKPMIIYGKTKFKSAESPLCNTSKASKASKGQWWKFELCDTEVLFWHSMYDHCSESTIRSKCHLLLSSLSASADSQAFMTCKVNSDNHGVNKLFIMWYSLYDPQISDYETTQWWLLFLRICIEDIGGLTVNDELALW